MSSMKKLTVFLLVFSSLFTYCACGSNTTDITGYWEGYIDASDLMSKWLAAKLNEELRTEADLDFRDLDLDFEFNIDINLDFKNNGKVIVEYDYDSAYNAVSNIFGKAYTEYKNYGLDNNGEPMDYDEFMHEAHFDINEVVMNMLGETTSVFDYKIKHGFLYINGIENTYELDEKELFIEQDVDGEFSICYFLERK